MTTECGPCGGSGRRGDGYPGTLYFRCPDCNGTGRVEPEPDDVTFDVDPDLAGVLRCWGMPAEPDDDLADDDLADGIGPTCPACGSEAYGLGALGRLYWWRCRACGTDFTPDRIDE